MAPNDSGIKRLGVFGPPVHFCDFVGSDGGAVRVRLGCLRHADRPDDGRTAGRVGRPPVPGFQALVVLDSIEGRIRRRCLGSWSFRPVGGVARAQPGVNL